ncbi:MAG: cytochrome c oxidase accessory protein CcoG [Rhodothalassiaceae bacterium]
MTDKPAMDATPRGPQVARPGPVRRPPKNPLPPQPREGALYASRVKIHPRRVDGLYRRIKWLVMIVTLGVYYLTPWIRWDRGPNAPDQAVLIDFPGRRFYFFFIEIWPQEVYYITGLLILAALMLFLFTSLFGRVWCGYACPQTVWTDLFIHVERFIEGDRNKRMKLDRAPWTFEKIWKRTLVHSVWLLIAVATGGAWVFYFGDAPTLIGQIFRGEAPVAAYVAIAAFTFTTYSLGGLMREQVCTYMCPWPRIQGAMFDADTFLVSYKADRGEPRGPHKAGEPWEGRGDCIDCTACVQVCPVGIDIRNGPQLECIQCALCIDACNEVMDKVGRPRGLIDYETLAMPEARARGERPRIRLVRPRTVFYAVMIIIVGAIMLYSLMTRDFLDLTVIHDRNPLYVTLSDGSIRNGYRLKIVNKTHETRHFSVAAEGIAGLHILEGSGSGIANGQITVGPDSVEEVRLFLGVTPEGLSERGLEDGDAPIRITLVDEDSGEKLGKNTVFRAPKR